MDTVKLLMDLLNLKYNQNELCCDFVMEPQLVLPGTSKNLTGAQFVCHCKNIYVSRRSADAIWCCCFTTWAKQT